MRVMDRGARHRCEANESLTKKEREAERREDQETERETARGRQENSDRETKRVSERELEGERERGGRKAPPKDPLSCAPQGKLHQLSIHVLSSAPNVRSTRPAAGDGEIAM